MLEEINWCCYVSGNKHTNSFDVCYYFTKNY